MEVSDNAKRYWRFRHFKCRISKAYRTLSIIDLPTYTEIFMCIKNASTIDHFYYTIKYEGTLNIQLATEIRERIIKESAQCYMEKEKVESVVNELKMIIDSKQYTQAIDEHFDIEGPNKQKRITCKKK